MQKRKTKKTCYKVVTKVKHDQKMCKFCADFTSNASQICDGCAQEFGDWNY